LKYEAVKEARISRLQGYLPSGRSGVTGDRTAGDQRGQRGTRRPRAGFPEGGKHPDCRDGTPLRGGSRDGDLGRSGHAEGSPNPCRAHDHPTTMGCSTCYGGGELPTLPHGLAREGHGVPSLLANRPISRTQSLLHPSSAQPTVESGRRLARGVTKSGGLWCPTFRQACAVRETVSMVRCGSLPAFPRKGESCRMPRASKEARGKRRPTQRHGLSY